SRPRVQVRLPTVNEPNAVAATGGWLPPPCWIATVLATGWIPGPARPPTIIGCIGCAPCGPGGTPTSGGPGGYAPCGPAGIGIGPRFFRVTSRTTPTIPTSSTPPMITAATAPPPPSPSALA